MDSILYRLNQESLWLEYLEYKTEKGHLTIKEKTELIEFIHLKKYESVVQRIQNGEGLTIPEKKIINKIGSNKKRVVYSFKEDENRVLKLLSYLLYKYDDKQSPGCFSFRKGYGAHKAIYKIINSHNISNMWCYKLDIKDYFNSISIPILLPILKNVIDDDEFLYHFLELMLSENKACYADKIIEDTRGVMAGTPTSPFLANIYLTELDTYFIDRRILYARYSDDIIVFAWSEEKLIEYKTVIMTFLEKYKLSVNPKKEMVVAPSEPWEFLGVSFQENQIDLSLATRDKLKGKIRRKARALRRWQIKKKTSDEQAMKAMIKVFNRKFFELNDPSDLTWSRWFFPLVTVKDGLSEIDNYLQQYIRYIPSGCHSKKNYKTKYNDLKKLGYKSLVNEYYKFKKQREGKETTATE